MVLRALGEPGSLVGEESFVVQEAPMARPKEFVSQSLGALTAFLRTESAGGIVLLAATVVALLWANLASSYETVWHTHLGVATISKDLRHWVNDGLLTIFFFVVGLEIKRELVRGELRHLRVATLPLVAAFGGMVVPALVYIALNPHSPSQRGWAIPMATDIAFVVGALSLLGTRVTSGLKVFLLALAIIDDIGAIAVIAVAFSVHPDLLWLALAGLSVACVLSLRALRVARPPAYLVPAVALWFCALKSGLHPTLAGVALGLLTPAAPIHGREVLAQLESRLHPVSSFVAVPVFALANAGIVLTREALGDAVVSRVFWGIVAGLVVGKAVGIVGASRGTVALGLGRRPADVAWWEIAGGGALAGIGFTVSLFISGIAFTDPKLIEVAKTGVLAGSVASAASGTILLMARSRAAR
jgi:NhaA family Na+:H+ antiporter